MPAVSVDEWYQRELKTNAEEFAATNRQPITRVLGAGDYDVWVQMLAGLNNGRAKRRSLGIRRLLYDMILTQPVFYEFEAIAVPTLLIIGDKDNTAIGKDFAPPAVKAALGDYPALAKQAAARIRGARLVEFPELGHAPQIQDPQAFHNALLAGLAHY